MQEIQDTVQEIQDTFIKKNPKKLEKASFQHDIAYEYYKDLPRRTASDKVLCDKAFKMPKNPRYLVFQRDLPSMVYKFFDKKVKPCQPSILQTQLLQLRSVNVFDNQQNKYTEQVLEKNEKQMVYSSCKRNTWGADLAK